METSGQRWVVPLAWPNVGEAEVQAASESLRSGWLTAGPKVAEFESAISAYVGGDVHGVATNSCSAGLLLALKALDFGAGDEIITTTNTFSGTAMAIVHAGAEPVLVDIDPRTLNIDPRAIESAITPRTKAVIPVHLGGLACDMEAIGAIAARHDLRVIEDAAHALSATWRGRHIGNRTSDATVFSFSPTKPITTGEGGMLLTPHKHVAERARVLRLQGMDRSLADRHSGAKGAWRYDIIDAGYKFNMTDLNAAIGCVQLDGISVQLERRTTIAERYYNAFADLPVLLPDRARLGDQHSWHLFITQLAASARLERDDFIEAMATAGIQCGVHYIPIHMHSYWRERLGVRDTAYPVANEVYRRTVSLPLFSGMTDAQVDHVTSTVRRILA